MADLTDIQSAAPVKLIGSDSAGVEQLPVQSTAGGGFHVNLRSAAGVEIIPASSATEGPPGSPVPVSAVYVGGTDGTNLRGLSTDTTGKLNINIASSGLPYINRTDASATVTASGNSGTLSADAFGCLSYLISVTAITGATTFQLESQTSDDGTNWSNLHSSTRFSATGFERFTATRVSARYYRFTWTVTGGAPSITFSVTSTLKPYLPVGSRTLNRFADVDLTATNNTSTVFTVFGNQSSSVQIIRAADGGNNAVVRVQGSNDGANWSDLTINITMVAGTNVLQTFSGLSMRNLRIIVTNPSNAGTRTLDLLWSSNGGS